MFLGFRRLFFSFLFCVFNGRLLSGFFGIGWIRKCIQVVFANKGRGKEKKDGKTYPHESQRSEKVIVFHFTPLIALSMLMISTRRSTRCSWYCFPPSREALLGVPEVPPACKTDFFCSGIELGP